MSTVINQQTLARVTDLCNRDPVSLHSLHVHPERDTLKLAGPRSPLIG